MQLYKRILLTFITLLIYNNFVFSQSLESDAATNFDDENYRVALKQYLKLLNTDSNNVEFNYKIGICYLRTNVNKSNAVKYLEYADSVGYFETDVKLNLGIAYTHAHRFDEAISMFKKYKEVIRDKIDTEKIRLLNRYVEECENAKKLIEKPLDVSFYNLGTNINSQRSDYHPHVLPDGSMMVFSSNKKYIKDYQQYVENCYYSYPVKNDFGEWAKAISFGKYVNTDENENVVALSIDGTKALLHLDRVSANNDLGITAISGTRFKEPVVFDKNINTKFDEEGACFSVTRDTIIFASNKPEGQGGFDLYYIYKIGKDGWSKPENLGPAFNTPYDENFPEISYDNKLRFASKGYNSMGGYDIFECYWDKDKNGWSKPKNFGYPVNDTYDNLNISITKNGRYGYTAKWRKESVGDYDIYKVIFNDVPPTKIKYSGIIAIGDSINPKPLSSVSTDIKMKILDKMSGDVYIDLTEQAKNGAYNFEIIPGNYDFVIKGESYDLFHEILIIYEEQTIITEIKFNVYLKPKTQ
ncbi:MAG: hypothetical protein ABIJ97_15500 [Bacteroidota bacterium]